MVGDSLRESRLVVSGLKEGRGFNATRGASRPALNPLSAVGEWGERREAAMSIRRDPLPKGPEPLREILSRLFTARGWGRRQGQLQLEKIWAEVVGVEFAAQTRVNGLRRGVLEVVVGNAVLLQELAHYHKRRLLEGLC
jgi:hypothetical protein